LSAPFLVTTQPTPAEKGTAMTDVQKCEGPPRQATQRENRRDDLPQSLPRSVASLHEARARRARRLALLLAMESDGYQTTEARLWNDDRRTA